MMRRNSSAHTKPGVKDVEGLGRPASSLLSFQHPNLPPVIIVGQSTFPVCLSSYPSLHQHQFQPRDHSSFLSESVQISASSFEAACVRVGQLVLIHVAYLKLLY